MNSEQSNRDEKAEQSPIRHDLKYLHSPQDHIDEYFFATVSMKDWCFQRILHPLLDIIWGYKPGELISKSFLDFMGSPEEADCIKNTIIRSLQEGIPQNAFRLRFRGKDGSCKWLLWTMMHVPEQGLSYIRWIDITEIYNAQDRAEKAEKRYRTLFEDAADSMLLVDTQNGEILQFNTAAHNNLGYTREEFQGLGISDFDVLESHEQISERIEQILREGTTSFETKHRTKDGEVRDIYVTSRLIDIENRKCLLSHFHDVTERKKAEEALRESRMWFKNIFDGSRDAILIGNSAGRYVAANEAACLMTGYSRNELLSMTRMDLGWPEEREAALAYIDRMMAGDAVTGDSFIRRKDGEPILVEWNTRTITIKGENYIHFVGRDVRWREDKLERLRGERNRLVAAQEQVRRNVARDLHDGIGQELAALHMGLSGVISEFTGKCDKFNKKIGPSLEKSIELCGNIIIDIRRISRGLYPAQLEAFGLVEALRQLAQQPSRHMKVQVNVSESAKGVEFDEVSTISLYRIAQAAILNAANHSKCNNIDISLDYMKNFVYLNISDDGIGFNLADSIGKGMGLMSMKDWAHIAAGSCKIFSDSNGTKIRIALPIELASSKPLPSDKS